MFVGGFLVFSMTKYKNIGFLLQLRTISERTGVQTKLNAKQENIKNTYMFSATLNILDFLYHNLKPV